MARKWPTCRRDVEGAEEAGRRAGVVQEGRDAEEGRRGAEEAGVRRACRTARGAGRTRRPRRAPRRRGGGGGSDPMRNVEAAEEETRAVVDAAAAAWTARRGSLAASGQPRVSRPCRGE